ncbi:MAG: MFS transporter [Chloroflexi bacterium]|nr:MFS transporter [Chloroflexota bacterium]
MSNRPLDENRGMGGSRISLRNLGTFDSLKNPAYRLFFIGMIGFLTPMNMEMLVRSLLIYRITGSAAILGVMSLASALPMLFLSLFGGVLADRVHKKYVLLAGQSGSALVSLGVALSLTLGYLSVERPDSWWILFVASLFNGVISGLMLPSRQAIAPEIVRHDQMMNAISLGMLEMSALRLLAPAVSGFLIEAWGFAAVYYIMAGFYFISVFPIALMPLTRTITLRGRGTIADIKEGLHYIRRETVILLILVLIVFVSILSMPYQLLLPIFTDDILKVGAKGMGILMSVAGAGAIISSLFLASIPNKKRGLMLLISCLISGITLVGFAFSSSWSFSLTLIVFVGLGQTGRMALSNTLLQTYSTDEYRGRVISIYMMEFGLSSLGTFGAGLLAESMGVQWAVGGFAIVLVVLMILALAFLPRLRRLD